MPIEGYIASYQPTLMAGPILFRTGRVDTPLVSMIGGRQRSSNAEKFIIGQTVPAPKANEDCAVSEEQTLTPPDFTPVGRTQDTNVIEIHTKSISITDYSEGNRGMLSGFVPAGAVGNPANELDFQRNQKHLEFLQDMEWALINSKYQDRNGDNTKANKTRGLREAIKTNLYDCKGNEMSWQFLNELMISMQDNGASTVGLTLGCDTVTATQLAIEAKADGQQVFTGVANINGIALTQIQTLRGTVNLFEMRYLQPGEAFLLNLPMLSIVGQPTAAGNYYWVDMGRTGLGRKEMFYGAFGLDYGAEAAHGRLYNIATGYTPYKGHKVYVPEIVKTNEVVPEVTGATLAGATVGEATAALTMEYSATPASDPALTYQWQVGNSAIGVFTDIEGATEATYTPVEGDEGKFLRCIVTASGAATGTVTSNCKKVASAA